MVALGKWNGAIIVRQTSDPEAGEYGEPELVAMPMSCRRDAAAFRESLQADVNGDRVVDFHVRLLGNITPVAGDFVL